ncbi:MAG: hypothetical protein ACKOW9_04015 [Candidatus Paceibacterota bacterium]
MEDFERTPQISPSKEAFVKFQENDILKDLAKFNLPEQLTYFGRPLTRNDLINGILSNQGKEENITEVRKQVEGEVLGFMSYLANVGLSKEELKYFPVPIIKEQLLKYGLPKYQLETTAEIIKKNAGGIGASTHIESNPGLLAQANPVDLSVGNEDSQQSNKEKTEQEMVEKVLADPEVMHILRGSYRGDFGIKKIFKNNEYIEPTEQLNNIVEDPRGLERYIHEPGLPRKKEYFKAYPVFQAFSIGNGYGIQYEICSDGSPNKRDGQEVYWIIVPKNNAQINELLEKNPSVVLKLFNDKFYYVSEWSDDRSNMHIDHQSSSSKNLNRRKEGEADPDSDPRSFGSPLTLARDKYSIVSR